MGSKEDFWGNPRCSKNNNWLNANTTKDRFGNRTLKYLEQGEKVRTRSEKRKKKKRKGQAGRQGETEEKWR